MHKGYLAEGFAIVINALALVAVNVMISLAYWVATGANGAYLPVLSNLLFVEGAVILLFGALVEFFHFSGTKEIYRIVTSSHGLPERIGWKTAGNKQDEHEAGWALIFLGAILMALSIVALLDLLI